MILNWQPVGQNWSAELSNSTQGWTRQIIIDKNVMFIKFYVRPTKVAVVKHFGPMVGAPCCIFWELIGDII